MEPGDSRCSADPTSTVVERIGDVQMGEQVSGVLHDLGHVAALVERVRRAVEERHQWRVDRAHHVDRGLAVLDEVVGVRLQPQLDPFLSKTGSNSSIDRQNCASLMLAASGRPLNSEFMTLQSSSTVSWIARFQYRTAA